MSKIVIGALTAAVWFALCYVARAEGTAKLLITELALQNVSGHPTAETVIRGSGIEIA